jgi:hypothetical protein
MMESENVALKKESQKAFNTAMKNIKILIKVIYILTPTA